ITSLIVPNKLGSARYAGAARQLLTEQHHLFAIRDYSRIPVFPVAVYPIVYWVRKALPPTDTLVCYEQVQSVVDGIEQVNASSLQIDHSPKPWPIFAHPIATNVMARLRELPTLGQITQVIGAATVAEAYQLQPLLRDGPRDAPGLKFINSGTIDRYQIRWGEKPCRYLGQVYQHPHLPQELLNSLSPKRLHQATQPKLVLAGMTRALEGILDRDGTLLAGKSTTVITASLDLFYLLALLNSKLLSFVYQSLYGGDRLQGGYLRIGPPQIRTLPIVNPDLSISDERQGYQTLIALSQQRCQEQIAPEIAQELEDQIDSWVYRLYGLSDREIAGIEGRSD
ncbi:MAG: TaqI-like C-terminal specificity domain-containing protein, partial [Leptolyngbyaceae cyanobacterium bins.59]|nr:TaqI-like C-terminal specificity domain-containing protein [Leptolyngbyaceae cyanobacterium bins.59]